MYEIFDGKVMVEKVFIQQAKNIWTKFECIFICDQYLKKKLFIFNYYYPVGVYF